MSQGIALRRFDWLFWYACSLARDLEEPHWIASTLDGMSTADSDLRGTHQSYWLGAPQGERVAIHANQAKRVTKF